MGATGPLFCNDRRSRSPMKKDIKRGHAPTLTGRRKKGSTEDSRQITHAFKEFVAHSANVNCLSLGHKSGRVLATGGDDKKVNLWAVGKPNCILSLSGHSTAVECVRFGGSEEVVCAGSLSGALKIWDLEATKIVRTLTGHKANIRSIDFHPYGDFICTGSLDTNIKLWDIRRKGCIFTYKGHNLTVNSLKFSPDGQWIASAGEDCAVKLWDLRAGKMLTEFVSHVGAVSDVEFHPHEFLLASASHDRTVNVWDLEKFSLVSTSDADTGPIRTITFAPGGECVFAGATDVLKVFGWEPTRTFDSIAMGWGKVADIAIAHNQLIGAGFHGAYVSMYVIDLKRVQPMLGVGWGSGGRDHVNTSTKSVGISTSPAAPAAVPFKHGAAARKSFSKDKTSAKANCDSIKREEASDTGGDEPSEEDPPPVISNLNDYKEIFRTHRELSGSPPSGDTPPSPPSLQPRKGALREAHSMLPRPNKLDGNSNSSAASSASPPPPPLPSLHDRRGSAAETGTQIGTGTQISPHREPQSSNWSQPPYRARAVSESRRESTGAAPTLTPDHEHRYPIRHSPSEPYLMRQDPAICGPPTSSSPPVQHSSPSLPRLPTYGRQTPVGRQPFPPDVFGSQFAPTHQKHTSSPQISFLGVPKPKPVETFGYDKSYSDPASDFLNSAYSSRINGLDLDDLAPKFGGAMSMSNDGCLGGGEMSEQEVVSSVLRGHSPVMAVMASRARALQVTQRLWRTKDLKSAVEHAVAASDHAVLVDFLGVLNLRPSIWNLDILTLLLSPVSLLLQSKYESYVSCGCDALKLMIKNFAPMIKSNLQGPTHSVGIDISREERYKKCVDCFNHLISVKAFLLKRQTVPGKLGHTYRELAILMHTFD